MAAILCGFWTAASLDHFIKFGFRTVKFRFSIGLDHSKTEIENVPFSNGFGFRMVRIRAPTELEIWMADIVRFQILGFMKFYIIKIQTKCNTTSRTIQILDGFQIHTVLRKLETLPYVVKVTISNYNYDNEHNNGFEFVQYCSELVLFGCTRLHFITFICTCFNICKRLFLGFLKRTCFIFHIPSTL